MLELEHKLLVLSQVAERLNKEHITWAVGASLLLYLKGKTDTFHDIDLMLLEEDVDRAKAVLSELGELQPANPNAQYKTRTFLEYVINQVDFDVMAGFVIVKDGKDYDCSLKKEDIVETVSIHGQDIPLQSLAAWKYYYELMGRENKVKMIEKA